MTKVTALDMVQQIAAGKPLDCESGQIDALIRIGLAEREDDRLVLTDRGWAVLERAQ